jgi:hypothetical protein
MPWEGQLLPNGGFQPLFGSSAVTSRWPSRDGDKGPSAVEPTVGIDGAIELSRQRRTDGLRQDLVRLGRESLSRSASTLSPITTMSPGQANWHRIDRRTDVATELHADLARAERHRIFSLEHQRTSHQGNATHEIKW